MEEREEKVITRKVNDSRKQRKEQERDSVKEGRKEGKGRKRSEAKEG